MGGRVTKTSTKKRVDRLWSKVVREQAGNKCEVCGVSGEVKVLNAHHYIGRKNMRLRWELFNGVSLCYQHHVGGKESAHEDIEWWKAWFKENRGEDLKLIKSVKNEIQKWTIEGYKEKLEELQEELEAK